VPCDLGRLHAVLCSDEDIVIARNGTSVVRPVPVVGMSSLAAGRGARRGRAEIVGDLEELADDATEACGVR
jgi:hypothetical protein